MVLTEEHAARVAALKYGDLAAAGWGPRLRHRFGYFTPDDWYEAMLSVLVTQETHWLDVGCGRELVPFSPAGARLLAQRCKSLTGIDPSDNINENPYLQHRIKAKLEDFETTETFDLITLRMVVEHITTPEAAVAALSRLSRTGTKILIYTVDKFSPVALAAAVTPLSVHVQMKQLLWQGSEKDTFPTAYLMNTRGRLAALMTAGGFVEVDFRTLADTRTTSGFRVLNTLELSAWRVLRSIGVQYPERCLLGVYEKQAA